ncbi:MAG TPA: ISAs1 family transposase [Desulfobacteraceae bacterium]|nr:ISAs1 family transposase [Desulfobacteraceae bacterium]
MVADPGVIGGSDHKLIDIITITLCAIISGAGNRSEIEAYGKARYEWLEEFSELPCGIPVFIAVSAEELENCFLNRVRTVFNTSKSKAVPIDGKTLRRSRDQTSGKGAIHMVTAWCVENGIGSGRIKTSEKSNTIYPAWKTRQTCLQQAGEKGKAVRGHRGVENGLHWKLDVGLREDECRKRKENSSENFAIMRQIALNLLNQKKTVMKAGVNAKRLQAGRDNKYLPNLIKYLKF